MQVNLSTVELVVCKIEVNRYKFGHGLQLRAHSCSVRLTSTTYFQLLRTQGLVFSYRDTLLVFLPLYMETSSLNMSHIIITVKRRDRKTQNEEE
jgi:hypothetical protein